MKTSLRLLVAGALAGASGLSATAAVHRLVDAQAASIDATSWSLTDNGVAYTAVRKGTTDIPWISPSQGYNSGNSVGFRIWPTSTLDKITYPLVLGNLAYAPSASGGEGYTGFALRIPSATDFQPPTAKCLLVQWWQGSPYGPPLRLAITGGNATTLNWAFQVLNNDTKGNPSAPLITAGSGTMARNEWHAFVVRTRFDHTGGGVLEVWRNGALEVSWTGKLGYDPATKPYTGDTSGIAYPNQKIQIEFGLYREPQNLKQMYVIDQVKWADSYAEALP